MSVVAEEPPEGDDDWTEEQWLEWLANAPPDPESGRATKLTRATHSPSGTVLGAAMLGLGQWGDLAARGGSQLLALKFSRDDETEADLVGLELAARAGYDPKASVSLWNKMAKVGNGKGPPGALSFLSTHPTGPDRIKRLEANVPKVEGLYRAATDRG